MKCLHCLTEFFPEFCDGSVGFKKHPLAWRSPERKYGATGSFLMKTATCPRCLGAHIGLIFNTSTGTEVQPFKWVYPQRGAFSPAPPQVPAAIAKDYSEANEVLSVSPKASAALARRCLQSILASHGYKGRDLVKQIEAVLTENDTSKALPLALRENIDAIRNFGNFSAHPITDQTSLQIVEVEPGEAEWCLQILMDVFNHYYVAPIKAAEKRAALAAKLTAAGKPPMKGVEERSGEGSDVKLMGQDPIDADK